MGSYISVLSTFILYIRNDIPPRPKLVRNEPITEPFDCFPVTEEELKDDWVEYLEFVQNGFKHIN
jgi:hypothetical protein